MIKHGSGGSEEVSYYGFNAHSDVETLTDESGDTRATYGYTAYGKPDEDLFTGVDVPDPADPDADPYNPYRFNNQRWDQASGNLDMGFRDYDPGLNRFLTRDTYNGALDDLNLTTDPWTGNRYAFAAGNPITRIELDGHAVTECSGVRPDGGTCATAINGTISGMTAGQAAAESAADDRFAGRYSGGSGGSGGSGEGDVDGDAAGLADPWSAPTAGHPLSPRAAPASIAIASTVAPSRHSLASQAWPASSPAREVPGCVVVRSEGRYRSPREPSPCG